MEYVLGPSKTETMDALVYAKADEVRTRRAKGKRDLVRDYTETAYAAKSWLHSRRVVAQFEATAKGFDARYVVTNITHCGPQWLYDSLYCMCGAAEHLIKRHKAQLASDRTRCRSPLAARQSNATDPPHRRLLADAGSPRRHPPAAAARQRGILHHPAAVAEDRGTDQGNREPRPTGVCLQLSGRGAVPRAGRHADPAPDMSGGASAPAEPVPINPSRLPDRV